MTHKPHRLGSWSEVRETVAVLAVIASLVFVGLQIRQSNVQARGAAYQAIGIATSQTFSTLDQQTVRLFAEANYPKAFERWTLADWDRYSNAQMAGLRMVETLMLQVRQGVLKADALEQLGYALNSNPAILTPGFNCVWPGLKNFVGQNLRASIDQTLRDHPQPQCNIDLKALRDSAVFGSTSRR